MTNAILAEIITIGDEILIGQTIDTNSSWLGEKLDSLGYQVIQISSIQDKPEMIVSALDLAMERADLVIITGGLGPTKDDRTKQTLCDFFGMKLIFNDQVLDNIQKILSVRDVPIIDINRDQALVPDGCMVLNNPVGTAPGMLFEKGGKVVVSLPGVPFEMIGIAETELFSWLKENMLSQRRLFKMIMTTGFPESVLASKLSDWEDNLPDHLSLAYLPSPGIVKLRLTGEGKGEAVLNEELDFEIAKLNEIIPEAIYSFRHESLQAKVGAMLAKQHRTIGCAESCTGGKLAELITSTPGSSGYFKGSIVAYANEIKTSLLSVDEKLLEEYGAVSKPVIVQMVEQVRALLNVDYAIATSGIAGPDGGTIDKPVGLVWIAVSSKKKTVAQRFHFGNHRGRNVARSSLAGLNMLRKLMIEEHENA